MPAPHPRRRFRRLLFGALLALFAVEAALQLGAWLAWRRHPLGPAAQDAPRPHVVLCVGGGSTWGIGGSRDDAWPARLQRLLADDGPNWQVVQGSAPRRTSADAVRALPQQLAEARPAFVLLWLGDDDDPSTERVDAGEMPHADAFTWCWRTVGLLRRAAQWLRPAASDTDRGYLGDWHFGDVAFAFHEDGTARLGADTTRFTVAGPRLRVVLANGEGTPVAWRRVGERLELTADALGGAMLLEPGPPPADPTTLVDRLVTNGDLFAARQLLDSLLRGPLPTAATRARLAEIDVLCGDAAAARMALAELREAHAARPDADRAAALGRVLLALGQTADAASLLCAAGRPAVDDRLVATLRAAARGTDAAAAVVAAFGPAPATTMPDAETLAANLRLAVAMCRRYGATPVLLEPAGRDEPLRAIVARMADATGVARLALLERDAAASAATVAQHLRGR